MISAKRNLFLVFLLAVFVRRPAFSQTPKWADIGIVVDSAPISRYTEGSITAIEQARGLIAVVTGVTRALMSQRNVSARIGLIILRRVGHIQTVVRMSEGLDADRVIGKLDELKKVKVQRNSSRFEENEARAMIVDVRQSFANSPGNRDVAPDMLIWIAPYYRLPNESEHPDLMWWRDLTDGPDVVLGMKNYRDTYISGDQVTMVDRENKAAWGNLPPSMIRAAAVAIVALLRRCTSAYSSTDCYYGDPGHKECLVDTAFIPSPLHEHQKQYAKYCMNGTVVFNCTYVHECVDTCEKKAPRTWSPCVPTRDCGGSGTRIGTLSNNSKFFKHCQVTKEGNCPITGQPPCVITEPVTTRKAETTLNTTNEPATLVTELEPLLEPWQIAVISIAGTTIIIILFGLLACFVRVKVSGPKKKRELKHIHPVYDLKHIHPVYDKRRPLDGSTVGLGPSGYKRHSPIRPAYISMK